MDMVQKEKEALSQLKSDNAYSILIDKLPHGGEELIRVVEGLTDQLRDLDAVLHRFSQIGKRV